MSSDDELEFDEDDDEEEDDDDDDDDEEEDDEPISNLKSPTRKPRRSSSQTVSYAEDNDDDDDDSEDDDVPLAALKSSSSPSVKKKKAAPKKKKPAVKKPPAKKTASKASKAKSSAAKKKKEAAAAAAKKSSSNGNYRSASDALYGSESKKGKLIQQLLCRWWYAMTWPDPETLPDKPPKHYDGMDGFPGVYVCTSGDKVGHINDMRDHSEAPSFKNFCRKGASELKSLLLTALEKQKDDLIETEGKGASTEKELNDLIKWTNKLNPSTVDKEAEKVLKNAKIKL